MQLIGVHGVCDGIYPGIQTVGVNQSVMPDAPSAVTNVSRKSAKH